MKIKVVQQKGDLAFFDGCARFEFKDGVLTVTMIDGEMWTDELSPGARIYVMDDEGKTIDRIGMPDEST